jgi:hypothetical protein
MSTVGQTHKKAWRVRICLGYLFALGIFACAGTFVANIPRVLSPLAVLSSPIKLVNIHSGEGIAFESI